MAPAVRWNWEFRSSRTSAAPSPEFAFTRVRPTQGPTSATFGARQALCSPQLRLRGETASGWQQASFSTPVVITANTVYVASYNMTVGHFSADWNYFATAGFNNTPLHALQTPNGVFGTLGAYPTNTHQAANYWVDVFSRVHPLSLRPLPMALMRVAAPQRLMPAAAETRELCRVQPGRRLATTGTLLLSTELQPTSKPSIRTP